MIQVRSDTFDFVSGITVELDPLAQFERAIGVPPRPFQADLLTSTSQRIISMASRQLGKSSAHALICWMAFKRGETAVVIAPTDRQAREFLVRVKGFKDADPFAPVGLQFLKTVVEAPNHQGRILVMPATDSARGFTADVLILDEAALADDEAISAVLPMRKKETGRLLVTSTPMWRSGFFYDRWQAAIQGQAPDWQHIRGHYAEQAPDLIDLIEKEKQDLGPNRFAREYDLQFAGSGESAIGLDVLHRAINYERKALAL